MKVPGHRAVLPFSPNSRRPIRNAARVSALALLLLGVPSIGGAATEFFCTFAAAVNECGFEEQAKVPGRASIVSFGRDGSTAVRLHTEPGDNDVASSGAMERNDLLLSQAATDGFEGKEQWWAHSVLFPDDFAIPTWQMYVVFDFHNTASGPFQANFHLNFAPQIDISHPGNLVFRGYGGAYDMANPFGAVAVAGPVAKNVWHDFVYHVRWSSGSNGFFDAWIRAADEPIYRRVLAHRGPTLYENQGVYLKLANYHTPVCDPYPACIGSHSPSSVIHDRVVRGTTWQDVVIGNARLEGQHEEDSAIYQAPASWTQYGQEIGTFSGGTIKASNEPNATATFAFSGTAVSWMSVKCNVCGIATVSIDGRAPVAVDTAGNDAPSNLKSVPVYSVSGLAPGAHTIAITVTGAHSAGSTDNYVAVDGFWVTPITAN